MIVSIQFLRFVAAALVVLTHVRIELDKALPGDIVSFGDFGVDVFFVISGFIMSHISERRPDFFLLKRLVRIVPLYWAFTLLLAGVTYAFPALLESARFDPRHLAASLLFFPLWTETTGFKPILMLGWTLNYEMFFYALFYVSMRISHRYREHVCTALLCLVYLSLNLPSDVEPTSPLAFYGDSIVIEFVFGMLLGLVYRHSRRLRDGRLPVPLSVALILASAVAFYVSSFDPDMLERVPRFVVWGVPALALVAAVMGLESRFVRAGAAVRRASLLLGEISYPMYLIHIYFVALLSRIFGVASIGVSGLFVVSLLLTSLASYLALRLYDAPVRDVLSRALLPPPAKRVGASH